MHFIISWLVKQNALSIPLLRAPVFCFSSSSFYVKHLIILYGYHHPFHGCHPYSILHVDLTKLAHNTRVEVSSFNCVNYQNHSEISNTSSTSCICRTHVKFSNQLLALSLKIGERGELDRCKWLSIHRSKANHMQSGLVRSSVVMVKLRVCSNCCRAVNHALVMSSARSSTWMLEASQGPTPPPTLQGGVASMARPTIVTKAQH